MKFTACSSCFSSSFTINFFRIATTGREYRKGDADYWKGEADYWKGKADYRSEKLDYWKGEADYWKGEDFVERLEDRKEFENLSLIHI